MSFKVSKSSGPRAILPLGFSYWEFHGLWDKHRRILPGNRADAELQDSVCLINYQYSHTISDKITLLLNVRYKRIRAPLSFPELSFGGTKWNRRGRSVGQYFGSAIGNIFFLDAFFSHFSGGKPSACSKIA